MATLINILFREIEIFSNICLRLSTVYDSAYICLTTRNLKLG